MSHTTETDNPNTDPATERDLKYLHRLPQDRQIKAILKWLVNEDARRAALALGVLRRTGEAAAVTQMLVAEALAPRKSEHHRLKLLAAVEAFGGTLDVVAWSGLYAASFRHGPAIRDRISRLLARFGHATRHHPLPISQ